MCLAPLTIYTTARKVSKEGGQPFRLTIPCGHCAECLKRKSDEYQLRAYYQTMETFMHGGFVYFDTLTYDNEHLPTLNNYFNDLPPYVCFDRNHVRLFFVRLRRALTRTGYQVANNLSYFLASEYGTNPNFTHRPHYHIIFYSRVPNLDPYVLSHFVKTCWLYGRTDGIDYHPYSYVDKHIFGQRFNNNLVHALNVCNYCAKYISTNSDYQKTINTRLSSVMTSKFGIDWYDDYDSKKYFYTLKRQFCQFHLNSKGFGVSALKYNHNLDLVTSQGMLKMPCTKDVVKFIPLPTYFKRKLFYQMRKDWRGLRSWFRNDDGNKFYMEQFNTQIRLMSNRFESWHASLPNILPDNGQGTSIQKLVSQLMVGRSWFDLSLYLFAFKGRIMDKDSYQEVLKHQFDPNSSLDSWILRLLSIPEKDKDVIYNYSTPYDKYAFGGKFLFNHDLGDAQRGLEPFAYFYEQYADVAGTDHIYTLLKKQNKCISHEDFAVRYTFNSSCSELWKGFDSLFNLYLSTLSITNAQKQIAYETKEKLKEKHSVIRQIYSPNKKTI